MDQLNYVKKNLKIIGIYFVEKREKMGSSWSSDPKPLKVQFQIVENIEARITKLFIPRFKKTLVQAKPMF